MAFLHSDQIRIALLLKIIIQFHLLARVVNAGVGRFQVLLEFTGERVAAREAEVTTVLEIGYQIDIDSPSFVLASGGLLQRGQLHF